MIYYGTFINETIALHQMNDMNNFYFIDLIKNATEPVFVVRLEDGEDVWEWNFSMEDPSNYERIKSYIMKGVFEVDTMIELAEQLDVLFEDQFKNILLNQCDGDCENCPYDDQECYDEE